MGKKKLPKELGIVEQDNPEIVELRFPFSYERSSHPRLRDLRRRYKLKAVVRGARSEFDKFVLLRDWVKSRWSHGWDESKAKDASDGIALLEHAKRGLEFCCGSYTLLYAQCVLSLGYQARRLSISKKESDFIPPDEGNVGHSVTEVWSNEWRKWILMDPDLNCHYEHDGVPLSAYEIRVFWLNERWRDVELIRGKSPLIVSERPPEIWAKDGLKRVRREFEKMMRYNAMDYYHYIAVEMGNDFSSKKGRDQLGWVDEFSPPRPAKCNVAVGHPHTQNLSDLYWPLDHTHITLTCGRSHGRQPIPLLKVVLESAMPNLDRFVVKIDDGRGGRKSRTFNWKLKEGDNTIRVRSVNKSGVKGPQSRVTVRYNM